MSHRRGAKAGVRKARELERDIRDELAREAVAAPEFGAAMDLLRTSGAQECQVRYQAETEPTGWLLAGRWDRPGDSSARWDVGGGLSPLRAICRLLEQNLPACRRCRRRVWFDVGADDARPARVCRWEFTDAGWRRTCRWGWWRR